MSAFFLGLDVGGSKTHALIADQESRILGFGTAGPGNHEVVGYAGLTAALQSAVGDALHTAGLEPRRISGAGFGVAGYDWPAELARTQEAIATLELSCPQRVVNDSLLGLLAGSKRGWGVVVTAGTSNNCRGRDNRGREGRITGNGVLFGEYGGAYELVAKALHAVAYQWTQRGPRTILTDLFIREADAQDIVELLEGLALDRYRIGPEAAPLVFQAAEANDAVAAELITWAGRELGSLAVCVIRQLDLQNCRFDVVLSGSLFDGGERLIDPLKKTVQNEAPQAEFIRSLAPPVAGAILLAYECAGLPISANRRKRLIENTTRIVMETKG